MSSLEQRFTHRQYMVGSNFEFFHYKDEPQLEVEYHNHDFYEIYFFISGKVTYIVEGKSYSLKPGDILLVNNKELHKPIIEPGRIYERIVIWVNPDFIKRFCTGNSDLFTCFETTSKKKYNLLRPGTEIYSIIRGIVSKLNRACAHLSYGSDVLKETYLIELLVYLNRAYLDNDIGNIEEDTVYDPTINDIIHDINQNLGGDLSLEALSAKFYTSKYHLLRQFKKHTGYTLHSYIHQKRLITAKALLKDGMSLSNVCQACGFNDYSNFIRVFSKTFNISPKKYARQFIKETLD